ncbi:hypothetical protein E2C01_024345 [Portunus trituberculatus]|uniref:Uncharacterized protein n=1 Tax=Portunus trituberculatus TaxID=210409 RepID=A0A5B7EC18_PORTR|nr:hypothetical protein [Portunus trituberculatus]
MIVNKALASPALPPPLFCSNTGITGNTKAKYWYSGIPNMEEAKGTFKELMSAASQCRLLGVTWHGNGGSKDVTAWNDVIGHARRFLIPYDLLWWKQISSNTMVADKLFMELSKGIITLLD